MNADRRSFRMRRAAPRRHVWTCALLGVVIPACATGGGSQGAREPSPEPAAAETRGVEAPEGRPTSATDSAAASADDLVARYAPLELAEPRPPPVLPFGVLWTPSAPTEGSAVGVRVLQAVAGRQPAAVEGTFAGLPVRLARLDGTWFGIAAVPIGLTGEVELSLQFVFGDAGERKQRVVIPIRRRQWARTALRVAPRFSSPPADVMERIRRERERIRAVLDSASPEWLLDGPFDPPRPLQVTSSFGQERVFNGELQSRHTGIDLRGAEGEPARAAARGRVVLTGDFFYSGKGVVLDHGLGVYTGYFHLSKIRVSEGQLVAKGEIIGEVGATGRVTGPHLHWSAWVAGESLDATSLLEIPVP